MSIDASDYGSWDAVTMARLVREGRVAPRELAETALSLLEEHRSLNAAGDVVSADVVSEEAAPARGPFAGVPFAVKELLAWPGLPWTLGSRLFAANPAPGLTPYAARLRDAGLRVVCSSTSSEFGLLGSTESALRGPTLNPWGEGLSAGGSSGGSAVLVAAGIVPMAHGSDAGGSLRVPACLNGVFGFKPSNLRCAPALPDAGGYAGLVVDHAMTRSVRDSAHLLAATERTGGDAVHRPVGLVAGPDPRRLRIGLLLENLAGVLPAEPVRRAVEDAARLCATLGHEVFPVAAPPIDAAAASRGFFTAAALAMAQVADTGAAMLGRRPGPDELEPFTLELAAWAATLSPDARELAAQATADAARAYLSVFRQADVVLSPTLSVVSWPLGHFAPAAGRETLIRRTEDAVGYTPLHNACHSPAMSVPLGASAGLPVGVHFAAAPGADRTLLALAYELEAARPWWDHRPDLDWLRGTP